VTVAVNGAAASRPLLRRSPNCTSRHRDWRGGRSRSTARSASLSDVPSFFSPAVASRPNESRTQTGCGRLHRQALLAWRSVARIETVLRRSGSTRRSTPLKRPTSALAIFKSMRTPTRCAWPGICWTSRQRSSLSLVHRLYPSPVYTRCNCSSTCGRLRASGKTSNGDRAHSTSPREN